MRHLKHIVIPLLLAIVLFQTFATVGTIVQFHVNRKYYADVLCINKNRPELACEGQCVLMKRLKNEFDQQQDSERRSLQNLIDREVTLFIHNFNIDIVKHSPIIKRDKSPIIFSSTFVSQQSILDIFHPPAYIA